MNRGNYGNSSVPRPKAVSRCSRYARSTWPASTLQTTHPLSRARRSPLLRQNRCGPLSVLTPFGRQTSVLIALLLLTSCAPTGPTAKEIEQTLEQQNQEAVRSAEGSWKGASSLLTLDFSLSQQPDGLLRGTGMMKEASAGAAVPMTVSGTYHRPELSLTFSGMVYDGRPVTGAFAGTYTSFVGVTSTLRLTGENYTTAIRLLLQEPLR
jgi:hypothetical protein